MLMVDAHHLEKVEFISGVSCLEVVDSMCHVYFDDSRIYPPFPISDLISAVEEDD